MNNLKLYNAAKVIQRDPNIREFLTQTDPMALQQLDNAVARYEEENNILPVCSLNGKVQFYVNA